VHRDAGEPAAAKRHRHLATGSEHDNPAAASDDELVRGGAHHALDVLENTDTHVSDECAVNTEHRHADVVAVGDGDMTAARHEAESTGEVQLTVAAAKRPAGQHKAAVPAPEHAESVEALIRHHDEFIVGSHADRKDESTHANEAVEVQARRQYLHAAAAILRHKHGAVVGDPDLARLSNLQRPVVLPANDAVPLAVHSAVHVKGLGTTAVVDTSSVEPSGLTATPLQTDLTPGVSMTRLTNAPTPPTRKRVTEPPYTLASDRGMPSRPPSTVTRCSASPNTAATHMSGG
jgi:hypothetical protein